ncbi:MAG: M56 family metallopeptidase [Chlorobi bacterium]|nr:M56 family metallopeptidase [Chlorobiota bacterium]
MNYQSFLLEINLGLILFLSFYKAFLSNDTHFITNRIYLIAGIFLSLIISLPLFQNTISSNTTVVNNVLSPILVKVDNFNYSFTSENIKSYNFFKISYLIGVLFFILSFFYKIYNILKLYINGEKIKFEHYTVVNIKHDISPFSFFNIIFMNKSGINKNNTERIITHELIHVNQKHSIDVLIIEWLCIFLWFNPFIWLYKKAIKENHEYLADESVLQSGISFEGYKHLILSQIFGIPVATISNNFVKSLTKKRFKMMTKKKSNKVTLKTFLLLPIIPVFFILLTFSINSCNNSNVSHKSSVVKSDSVYFTVDEMPVFSGGTQKLQLFIAENVVYPEIAKKLNVEGKVYVGFVVDENGKVENVKIQRSATYEMEKNVGTTEEPTKYDAALALDKEAIRIVKTLPDWQPGKNNGKNVKVQYTVPINFRLN